MTGAVARSVESIHAGQPATDGAGVRMTRVIATQGLDHFDPFLLLDEFRSDDASDYIAGFPDHPHRGFETVTYMIDGALEHKDSMGNGSVIRPGDVQRMTAGTGVRHSEFNASRTEPVHFLQIWILPEKPGLEPGYEQKHFSADEKRDRLVLMASPDGRQGSLTIHQNAFLYGTIVEGGESLSHTVDNDSAIYVHLISGKLSVNGQAMSDGDGLGLRDVDSLDMHAREESELLIFEMEKEATP